MTPLILCTLFYSENFFTSIGIRGKTFCSAGKKSKPVVAMALWEEDLYGHPPTPLPDPNSNIRPVNVHHYAKVIYSVDGVPTHDILAFVSWSDILWANRLNYGASLFLNLLTIYAHLCHLRTSTVVVPMASSYTKMNIFSW